MYLKLQRFIAILILVIPGIVATYGFLGMKDAIFSLVGGAGMLWGKFIIGFILFVIGVAFIGGWIFFRDRKNNYVAPRFRDKSKRRRRPQS
ncbi:DUF2627 domain-containing protein [Paenibacillus sp. y28]|uniref:DUF2627 domain-containing protein n=1 Tax=Paenibacillus sp. y28 TaxID=3129110 RepID=UPI003019EFF9